MKELRDEVTETINVWFNIGHRVDPPVTLIDGITHNIVCLFSNVITLDDNLKMR